MHAHMTSPPSLSCTPEARKRCTGREAGGEMAKRIVALDLREWMRLEYRKLFLLVRKWMLRGGNDVTKRYTFRLGNMQKIDGIWERGCARCLIHRQERGGGGHHKQENMWLIRRTFGRIPSGASERHGLRVTRSLYCVYCRPSFMPSNSCVFQK